MSDGETEATTVKWWDWPKSGHANSVAGSFHADDSESFDDRTRPHCGDSPRDTLLKVIPRTDAPRTSLGYNEAGEQDRTLS
jgi:hypothetical protein